MIGYEEFQTKTISIVLVCYRLNFQNLFSPQTREYENRNKRKDHLHNIGLLQAAPRFLVLPPGMLANANNPGNAKYICFTNEIIECIRESYEERVT